MRAVLAGWRRRVAGAGDAGFVGSGSADAGTGPPRPRFGPFRFGPFRFGAWFAGPLTSFHLMVSVAGLLTTLGLIMVLSASGVHSYDEDGSPWSIFNRQLLWAAVGLFACWFALRLPVRLMRATAFLAFSVTIVMLVAVLIPGIGRMANGTRGWFVVGGLSMQPSELTKIAFVVWGSHLLAARRMERASLREMLIPLIPAAVIALALIVAQPDLGQTVSLGIILLALLWFAGLPLKVFVTSLLATIAAAAVLAVSAGYRSARVQSWLDPGADTQGAGYQARQAKFALANGGVFGDGLGQGTAKWNYLPNAHNDFIFAIVGEELGFIGAFGLLALFGLFAYTGMRIGGTSTATTLFMVGLMANAARHEPPAVAALRAGRDDRMNRLLRLPLPEPYLPARAVRDRLPKPERTAVPARTAQKSQTAQKRKTVQKSQTVQKAKPGIKAKAATKTGKRAPGTVEVAGKRAKTVAKAGTARGSGHLGGASQQRRGGAAKAQTKQETGRSRRSRTLEGQRYG